MSSGCATTHSTDAKEPSKGSTWGGAAGSVIGRSVCRDPPRRHTRNGRCRLRAHGPARRARAFAVEHLDRTAVQGNDSVGRQPTQHPVGRRSGCARELADRVLGQRDDHGAGALRRVVAVADLEEPPDDPLLGGDVQRLEQVVGEPRSPAGRASRRAAARSSGGRTGAARPRRTPGSASPRVRGPRPSTCGVAATRAAPSRRTCRRVRGSRRSRCPRPRCCGGRRADPRRRGAPCRRGRPRGRPPRRGRTAAGGPRRARPAGRHPTGPASSAHSIPPVQHAASSVSRRAHSVAARE